ncbi:MAG: dihydroorotate dehydrogenase-like protein [Phycisphaerae bacterium]|nr:dihydroorotate dehydrogenase-like protein [Phycisphaerae bacterium]
MDLTTTYMNLELPSPLVPSASPLSRDLDNILKMADAGAGAVVLWSLFEEQIEHEAHELEHYLQYGAERFAESLSYFPQPQQFHLGPEEYLEHIRRAKQAVDIPIIASLNGVSDRGWANYAEQMAEAGADAIELNVYYIPALTNVTAAQVEQVYLDILKRVRSRVTVPVAMKLSPYFSSLGHFAGRLADAGADGLVLFNRFYQPDLDIDDLQVAPTVTLSRSEDLRLPLRWIAILSGRIEASLACTTGVHTAEDAAKAILAGADVAMMCSVLLNEGIGRISAIRGGLLRIMEHTGYESVREMRGVLNQENCAEPAAFERANYVKALHSFGRTATRE